MKISLPTTHRARTAQDAQTARVEAQLRRHVPLPPPVGAQSRPGQSRELRRAIACSPQSEGILWWRLGSHPWWRLP